MENWLDVIGYEGIYKVSNLGNVAYANGKLKKQSIDRHGYKRIVITNNGKYIHKLVHRMVAISFIPNPENKSQVNHKNRVRDDNRIENLEWCTGKENIIHSFRNGRKPTIQCGERAKQHILKEHQIPLIRQMIKAGFTLKQIGHQYGVSLHTIYSVKSGKNWKHIKQ